ncbi:hypothetical protein [Abyssisolibacter fermentans]|uniref:hypothetical protein n=1 Tax=Abyssisolibacter fermentans TaxID=1766203 RepID=UPI00082AC902|nr:hypothetical protein [Abyssisolibacter fermentans]
MKKRMFIILSFFMFLFMTKVNANVCYADVKESHIKENNIMQVFKDVGTYTQDLYNKEIKESNIIRLFKNVGVLSSDSNIGNDIDQETLDKISNKYGLSKGKKKPRKIIQIGDFGYSGNGTKLIIVLLLLLIF